MPLYEDIPFGFRGTARTIDYMKQLAAKDAKNWNFIRIATNITKGTPARDDAAIATRLLDFVKGFVRFVRDPVTAGGAGMELVQAPFKTLYRKAGDCDDLSGLIAALAMAHGIQAAFVTIKADPRMPDEFSHVYTVLLINGKWLGADASVQKSYLGWEPGIQIGRQEWRV